jgi:uncharacterized protein (DUF2461 family)
LLRRWRERIVNEPEPFLQLAESLREAGLGFEATGENRLKRMPRGFEPYAEADVADFLKWKGGFVDLQKLDDEALQSPTFTDDVAAFAREALPLLEYGWAVADPA